MGIYIKFNQQKLDYGMVCNAFCERNSIKWAVVNTWRRSNQPGLNPILPLEDRRSEAKRSGQLVTNDFIPYITSTEIDCRTCVVVAVAISLRLSYLHIELILQSLARNISILNVMKSINVAWMNSSQQHLISCVACPHAHHNYN